jgi:dCTP deaminase
MLLSYNKLIELIESGVINVPLENVNGASIDITLSNTVMLEEVTPARKHVSLKDKHNIKMHEFVMDKGSCFHLHPNQFLLASSNETFNLPNNIACEYKLKSSLARNGLQHMLAGWCDPGWNDSTLTLELKNVTQFHTLVLEPGMKIGQMVFFECDPVPEEHSYASKGQYNGQTSTTPSKGLR